MTMYIQGPHLNGFWDDVGSALKRVYSTAEPLVNEQVDKAKQQIRFEAGEGAKAAVAPYVFGAMGLSAVAIVMSISALIVAKKARRGA